MRTSTFIVTALLLSLAASAEAGPPPPAQMQTPRMSQPMQQRIQSTTRPPLTNNAHTDHAHWATADGPVFHGDAARATDVKQGSYLGDCYFESPMAAVAARNPGWIKNLVRENDNGTVTVRLYVRDKKDKETGKWSFMPVEQTFDRKLPVTEEGRPYSPGKALWPAFVQLAYAKLTGGYTKLNQGGSGHVGLEMLTGREAENKTIDPIKDANVGEKIREAIRAGKPVVLGSRTRLELAAALQRIQKSNPELYAKVKKLTADPEKAFDKLGIVESHEYHVLAGGAKDGHQLTVVRNPWGSFKPSAEGPGKGKVIDEGNGVFPIDDAWLPLVYGDYAIGDIPTS